MLDYLRQIDPLPRNARRFQKQRDAVMAEFAKVGEIPTCEQIAQALGVPMRRFVRLSVMITASEPISLAEPP